MNGLFTKTARDEVVIKAKANSTYMIQADRNIVEQLCEMVEVLEAKCEINRLKCLEICKEKMRLETQLENERSAATNEHS